MDFISSCFSYLFGIMIAVVVLLVIAMPERFFKPKTSKKKTVGPSYWGNYHYTSGYAEDENAQIEVTVHQRKDKIHVGGTAYQAGRGVRQ